MKYLGKVEQKKALITSVVCNLQLRFEHGKVGYWMGEGRLQPLGMGVLRGSLGMGWSGIFILCCYPSFFLGELISNQKLKAESQR